MNITFRADASPLLGTGHVMRSLCLADALRSRGSRVQFLCRDLPPHLHALITSHSHAFAALPSIDAAQLPNKAETPWPHPLQSIDAQQCTAAIAAMHGTDWLVVDHYGLDAAWESAMRPATGQVLAIDDLGRSHDCDLLLDQNPYAHPEERYASRLPAQAQMLLGLSHALLRPEFLAARAGLAARDGEVRRVLVFFGGVDAGDATSVALRVLERLRPPGCEVDAVIGASHPAKAALLSRAAGSAWLRCHVQTPDMATLCASADLAIGAGGSASWERCALGLPALVFCLADNQREVLREGARQGLLYAVEGPVSAAALRRHLAALLANPGLRNHLSHTGLTTVDARGPERVALRMLASGVTVRQARMDDASMLHAWRNQARVRAASRHTQEIVPEEHTLWLQQILQSPQRSLLVGEAGGKPVGVVRFDLEGGRAEVSIYLGPEHASRGRGLALLQSAQRWLMAHYPGVRQLDAEVLGDNTQSHQLFVRAGYHRSTTRYSLFFS